MRPRRRRAAWILAFAACAVAVTPATATAKSSFLTDVLARLADHPNEMHLNYYAAMLYARQGQWDAAAQALDALIRAGWRADIDPTQFAGYEEHREVAEKIAALRRQADRGTNSRLTFSLGERDLIPEGITYDAKTDSFLLGSIHKSKVIRVTRAGAASDLVAPRTGGLDEVLGLKADAERRVLWVASLSPSSGATAIVRFDLDTGALLGRHELRARGRFFGFNDLCLDSGRAFATEMGDGAVYEISAQSAAPRVLVKPGRLHSPNGVACDAGVVWVSDAFALHAVDMRSGEMREIESVGAFSGAGIDGLVVADNRLIGVQNAFGRGRIIELTPDPARTRIAAARILESAHPAFGIPTTGVIVDDAFHYIANSQFFLISNEGKLAPADELRDVLILNLPLGAGEKTRGATRREESLTVARRLSPAAIELRQGSR